MTNMTKRTFQTQKPINNHNNNNKNSKCRREWPGPAGLHEASRSVMRWMWLAAMKRSKKRVSSMLTRTKSLAVMTERSKAANAVVLRTFLQFAGVNLVEAIHADQ